MLDTTLLFVPIALLLGFAVVKVLYNLFAHPLRTYPGPLLARATLLVYHRQILSGYKHLWLQKLHEKYGTVVRVSPNVLSIIEPDAWKDAYGYKTPSFAKDVKGTLGPDPLGNPPGLLRADDVSHARQRRLVSHAFSDRALKDQEPILKSYAQLLVAKLTEAAKKKQEAGVDLIDWYNFTTFDIMADLTFGESLGQLESATYSDWVQGTFALIKVMTISRIGREWPGLTKLLQSLVPAEVKARKQTHVKFSVEKVNRRMARKTERPDFWTYVTKHGDTECKGLAPTELQSNGQIFMLAGTETTATLLSGLTYMLLKHPDKLERVTREVRDAFKSFDDMTMTKLSQLSYLQACIEEGLRLYPPLGTSIPRIVPEGGASVCGRWLPAGVHVEVPIYAASRSPTNFRDPEEFVPERSFAEGSEKYGSDKRDASVPFSYGPRNCLGKNLAYHEMRLVLASVLLHFDLELCDEEQDWMDQENYIMWVRKPLFVRLKLV